MEAQNLPDLQLINTTFCYVTVLDEVSHPTFYHVLAAVLLFFSTCFILTENIFCLVVLYKNTTARFPVRLFLASLAANDICVGLLMALPSTIAAVYDDWVFGCTFCDITGTTLSVNGALGTLSLLLLSIDTYLVIAYPLTHHLKMTSNRAKIAVALIWVLSLLQLVIRLPLLSVTRINIYAHSFFRCFQIFPNPNNRDYVNLVIVSGLITLPFVVTVFIYMRLLLIARNQRVKTQRELFGNRHVNTGQKSNLKAIRTFLIVTLAFGLSHIPFSVIISFISTTDLDIPNVIEFISYLFLLSNSWFNFLVYYLRNESFRRTTQKLLRRDKKRTLQNKPR